MGPRLIGIIERLNLSVFSYIYVFPCVSFMGIGRRGEVSFRLVCSLFASTERHVNIGYPSTATEEF